MAAVAVIVAGVLVLLPEDQAPGASATVPQPAGGPSSVQAADTFLRLLSIGKAAEAAALTDNPAAAQAAFTALGRNTAPTVALFVRKGGGEPPAGAATAVMTIEGSITITAANKWVSSLDMVKSGDKWLVKWLPTLLHPRLAEGQSIAILGQAGQSGQPALLGEDDKPLVIWQGTEAKPVDPKISPLLLKSLVGGSAPTGNPDAKRVSIVDAAGKEVGQPLFGEAAPPVSAEPVKSTLNQPIAVAAQNAVATAGQPTMLVAIRPSTGGILAVAQNDAAGTALNALNGQYQPGSSVKIATAAAAIQQAGMSLDSDVRCPEQQTVGNRTIRNAGFGFPGTTKLRTAFARSCNTTFAAIAAGLPADGLTKAATQFGLNSDYTVPGITTEMGKVESTDNAAQRVEDSIGQGNVLASPLGMAVVAATVAARKAVTPQLLKDTKTEVGTGYQAPPVAVLAQLHTMMGEVVSGGTAAQLKKFGGLRGKTGTAETTNNGTEANGWFVGYRGDVAFAVLVVGGNSSAPALAVTAAFLSGF
ncbi:MAG: penicillin-binding transpeptidase domain-containing protein [Kibdelosporangium sp.]